MGIDLTLLPQWINFNHGPFRAIVTFPLDRDSNVFKALKSLQPLPFNRRIDWYGEDGIESRTTDYYDEPLTFLPAGTIQTAIECGIFPQPESDWNRAIFAFIREVDPDRKVILFWS